MRHRLLACNTRTSHHIDRPCPLDACVSWPRDVSLLFSSVLLSAALSPWEQLFTGEENVNFTMCIRACANKSKANHQCQRMKAEGIQRKEKQNSMRNYELRKLCDWVQMSCFNLMYVYRHYSFSTPTDRQLELIPARHWHY